MSPTSRTLTELRKRGWHAGKVEMWLPHTKITKDLFGFIDVVVLDGQSGVLAIQATSTSNMGARVKKIVASPVLRPWLRAGNRVQVWGWAQRGARGMAKAWTLKVTEVKARA